MTELILNSNEHKVDVNKLRYEFKSPIRFDNSFISLTQGIFYNFFHNVKQDYEMTVERIHPKAPVMLIFIAIFTCLPSCINLSNKDYEMKVKKDDTYYNISFIDSMLEVEDIDKIINDELIRHKLLTLLNSLVT